MFTPLTPESSMFLANNIPVMIPSVVHEIVSGVECGLNPSLEQVSFEELATPLKINHARLLVDLINIIAHRELTVEDVLEVYTTYFPKGVAVNDSSKIIEECRVFDELSAVKKIKYTVLHGVILRYLRHPSFPVGLKMSCEEDQHGNLMIEYLHVPTISGNKTLH